MIENSLSLAGGAMRAGAGRVGLPSSAVIRALYDPSVLPSLYQDAEMTTPVTQDGDPVGAIRDLSGHGFHLKQPTTSARPIYRSAEGLHWIESDGVDDALVCAFALSTYPVTLVAGLEMLQADDEGGIIALHKDNNSYKTLMQSASSSYQLRATDRASSVLDARATITESRHIASARFETSAMTLSVDGVQKGTTSNTNVMTDLTELRLFSFRESDRWKGRLYAFAVVVGAVDTDVSKWLAERTLVTL